MILPAIFIVLHLLFLMVRTPSDPEPPLNLNPWLYGDASYSFYAQRGANFDWSDRYVIELLNGTGMGVRCAIDDPLG